MTAATLTIRLGNIAANWAAMAALSAGQVETGAVVKADAYGLGVAPVATALAKAGAKTFFVALAKEGAAARQAVGAGAEIFVFAGHMEGDTDTIRAHNLTPLLNSARQIARHFDLTPDAGFGVQLDTGMNRLGLEPGEFAPRVAQLVAREPRLFMSHLACADDPTHPQNKAQLAAFHQMTDGLGVRRSLSATGGTLLGAAYHFDLIRPGIGLYSGLPFAAARPVVGLSIPVVQVRDVKPGETVGYSATWTAARQSRIATLAAGYADGLIRAMGDSAGVWTQGTRCPVVGRVSMDLLAVDVTDLPTVPDAFDILGPDQRLDQLARAAGTIGYEILTSLGARYERVYTGA